MLDQKVNTTKEKDWFRNIKDKFVSRSRNEDGTIETPILTMAGVIWLVSMYQKMVKKNSGARINTVGPTASNWTNWVLQRL